LAQWLLENNAEQDNYDSLLDASNANKESSKGCDGHLAWHLASKFNSQDDLPLLDFTLKAEDSAQEGFMK
jgi:hypothetical protein